jgi:hypothetical protein
LSLIILNILFYYSFFLNYLVKQKTSWRRSPNRRSVDLIIFKKTRIDFLTEILFLCQSRALWLLIWWPLKAYMIVNFRAREISRGTRKLTWTPTLNWKKKKVLTTRKLLHHQSTISSIDNHNGRWYPACFAVVTSVWRLSHGHPTKNNVNTFPATLTLLKV